MEYYWLICSSLSIGPIYAILRAVLTSETPSYSIFSVAGFDCAKPRCGRTEAFGLRCPIPPQQQPFNGWSPATPQGVITSGSTAGPAAPPAYSTSYTYAPPTDVRARGRARTRGRESREAALDTALVSVWHARKKGQGGRVVGTRVYSQYWAPA